MPRLVAGGFFHDCDVGSFALLHTLVPGADRHHDFPPLHPTAFHPNADPLESGRMRAGLGLFDAPDGNHGFATTGRVSAIKATLPANDSGGGYGLQVVEPQAGGHYLTAWSQVSDLVSDALAVDVATATYHPGTGTPGFDPGNFSNTHLRRAISTANEDFSDHLGFSVTIDDVARGMIGKNTFHNAAVDKLRTWVDSFAVPELQVVLKEHRDWHAHAFVRASPALAWWRMTDACFLETMRLFLLVPDERITTNGIVCPDHDKEFALTRYRAQHSDSSAPSQTIDLYGHALLQGPLTDRHNHHAERLATCFRSAGSTSTYERDPRAGGNSCPRDGNSHVEIKLHRAASRGGDDYLDLTFVGTTTPHAMHHHQPDVHTSRSMLAQADSGKVRHYRPLIDPLDDIHGMAITCHGRAGASYTSQLVRAFDRFSRRHQHDPVSWTAPTQVVQWRQSLSVSFWTATSTAYASRVETWARKARPLDPAPRARRNVFQH